MLTLNDGRAELWQWDTGRTLSVDADCSQVHFSNKVFGRSIDVDVADGVAVIPDILLQTDKDLNVWAFVGTAENGYTKISKTFKVNRRNKPADYVFTPQDQTSLEEIKEKIDYLESIQDPDAIKNAVEDYLEKNPVEAPVQSVNGRTGEVELTAEDVGAISQGDLQEATNEALAQAKASGEFDGADGAPGKDGADGITPTIGYNGNWYLGDTDTGKPSRGEPGQNGADGKDGAPGAAGADGHTPVKGTDYFTEADKQEIAESAAGMVSIPDKLPNPNALTFTGAVTGTYDGSAGVTVNIPSGGGGGSSGGSGKAKSQILIDQEITELTASLSVTLEHDFHNLTAIISCGLAGAALTADSDGTAAASKIALMIDATYFSYNSRKVAYIDASTATWQTRMFGAEWSDDLSVFKRGFTAEIVTGVGKPYYFPFGGTTAMYGTLGTDDNAPRTGKTANIVVSGAYLNVGTKVVLWGEYYE